MRFSVSFREVEELLAKPGLSADHVTVWRWVQRFGPEIYPLGHATGRILRLPAAVQTHILSSIFGLDDGVAGKKPGNAARVPSDLEALINKRLSSGPYASPEDVLRRALEAQDAEESWIDDERRALNPYRRRLFAGRTRRIRRRHTGATTSRK